MQAEKFDHLLAIAVDYATRKQISLSDEVLAYSPPVIQYSRKDMPIEPSNKMLPITILGKLTMDMTDDSNRRSGFKAT